MEYIKINKRVPTFIMKSGRETSNRVTTQIREQMVPRFHNMQNQFCAVGCGVGWTMKKGVDYEQLFRPVFSLSIKKEK